MKALLNKIFALFLTLGLTATLIPADIVRAAEVNSRVNDLGENSKVDLETDLMRLGPDSLTLYSGKQILENEYYNRI